MSQTPRRLRPDRSMRDWFGAELRYWRELRGLSQERLAARVPFGEDMIGKVEKAERWPSLDMAVALDEALGTGGVLQRAWPLVDAEREKRLGRGENPGSEADFVANLERLGSVGGSVIYASRGDTGPWRVGRRHRVVRGVVPSLLGTGTGHPGGPSVEGLIAMSGFDSAGFVDEPSNVGPARMEELRTETARLAGMFANAPRLEVFFQTDLHRRRIFALLDGRQRLNESRELYFLAGAALGMLADVTVNLGYHDTAMSHARAALLCAREAGHDGLIAFVRCQQAMIAYWAGRPIHAVEFARTGLESSTSGTVTTRLSAMEARAAGALGDARTVRAALERAGEARENVVPDDLDDIGGLLTYPIAKQHFHAGQAYLGLRQGPATVTEAEACVTAYQNGPHEERVIDAECMAQVDLATAHALAGDLEAARAAVQPALAIAPDLHTDQIDAELRALHRELCASAVHDSPVAVDLRDQIEDFLTTALPRPPSQEV